MKLNARGPSVGGALGSRRGKPPLGKGILPPLRPPPGEGILLPLPSLLGEGSSWRRGRLASREDDVAARECGATNGRRRVVDTVGRGGSPAPENPPDDALPSIEISVQ